MCTMNVRRMFLITKLQFATSFIYLNVVYTIVCVVYDCLCVCAGPSIIHGTPPSHTDGDVVCALLVRHPLYAQFVPRSLNIILKLNYQKSYFITFWQLTENVISLLHTRLTQHMWPHTHMNAHQFRSMQFTALFFRLYSESWWADSSGTQGLVAQRSHV